MPEDDGELSVAKKEEGELEQGTSDSGEDTAAETSGGNDDYIGEMVPIQLPENDEDDSSLFKKDAENVGDIRQGWCQCIQ